MNMNSLEINNEFTSEPKNNFELELVKLVSNINISNIHKLLIEYKNDERICNNNKYMEYIKYYEKNVEILINNLVRFFTFIKSTNIPLEPVFMTEEETNEFVNILFDETIHRKIKDTNIISKFILSLNEEDKNKIIREANLSIKNKPKKLSCLKKVFLGCCSCFVIPIYMIMSCCVSTTDREEEDTITTTTTTPN